MASPEVKTSLSAILSHLTILTARFEVFERDLERVKSVLEINGTEERPKTNGGAAPVYENIFSLNWRKVQWERLVELGIVPNKLYFKRDHVGKIVKVVGVCARKDVRDKHHVNSGLMHLLMNDPEKKLVNVPTNDRIVRLTTVNVTNGQTVSIDAEHVAADLAIELNGKKPNPTQVPGGTDYWYVTIDGKFSPKDSGHYFKDEL